MRNKFLIFLIGAMLLMTACSNESRKTTEQEQPFLSKIEFSNINDEKTWQELKKLMKDAGISDKRQENLLQHIEQFNNTIDREQLTEGFEIFDGYDGKHDPDVAQSCWVEKHPNFEGYNCRITGYTVFGDFIEIDRNAEKMDDLLFLDKTSLQQDSSAVDEDGELDKFKILFSKVPTTLTKDISVHLANVQKAWKERGIEFKDNKKASFITVFFQDPVDTQFLFPGHVGILFEKSDKELYFLEKVAFQEPYQLVRLRNRVELNDYLMGKYDVEWGQETAKPFIMENDQLLKGYRPNPNTKTEN